jgi:hypothetical protein
LSLQSYAQTNLGLITGNALYENKSAAAGASVDLFSLNDSSFKRMAIADKAGEFSINTLPFGWYRIQITSVGYQSIVCTIGR